MLKKENAEDRSIFHIMTDVAGWVALNCSSNPGNYKQVPSFNSRLTRDLVFGRKQENGQASLAGIDNDINMSDLAELG
jgi:hypothetical protein